MNVKCPTCGSKECGPVRCRFTMTEHKEAAPQATPSLDAMESGLQDGSRGPAVAASDIGYEAAWTGVPSA